MIKDFLIKQMLKSKLKDLPESQRDILIELVSKNPEFFEKIAKEIQTETKNGKDEQVAAMEVIAKHRGELQKLMQR